jgi:hypothetical protein
VNGLPSLITHACSLSPILVTLPNESVGGLRLSLAGALTLFVDSFVHRIIQEHGILSIDQDITRLISGCCRRTTSGPAASRIISTRPCALTCLPTRSPSTDGTRKEFAIIWMNDRDALGVLRSAARPRTVSP